MLWDFNKDELGADISADVCVVGAGVAGQTLAMRLASEGRSVILVESGGLEFNSGTQALSDGDVSGEPYYDLISSRLRLFGGTAAIWGGRCAELDPIDFERRDFVPHSGWPIEKADLEPYYKRAYALLGIDQPNAKPPLRSTSVDMKGFAPDRLETGFWRFDEDGERFTNTSRGNLSDVDILLNANMTEMDVAETGEVKAITVSSSTGKRTKILARNYVLAAGAIETVRLLMGSVPQRPNGFGNARDLLGRYFMEHPHARGGEIVSEKLATSLRALPRMQRAQGRRFAAYVRLSEAEQRRQGVLNSSLSLAPRRHEGDSPELVRALKEKLKHDLPSTRFWRTSYKRLKNLSTMAREQVDPWASVWAVKQPGSQRGLYAVIRAEQAPNPESRIILSSRKDRYGTPLAELNWQFSELDKRSVKALMTTLKSEYQRLGWGDVQLADWLDDPSTRWAFDPLISSHPIGGYHHMGGTRMAEDPALGVVDANSRLFESPNLYIASSSVFPTGGWANPTLTIIALAERLADHLLKT
ncbi:MAG: GMC family oxidoreductase [Henriciella sp.]|nr:GMC family oxidoreductase [Henriciella sp.]